MYFEGVVNKDKKVTSVINRKIETKSKEGEEKSDLTGNPLLDTVRQQRLVYRIDAI